MRRFAFEIVAPVLKTQTTNRENTVSTIANMVHDLAGPRDGIQAAAEILDRFGIRSIFISAFSDPTTRARANRANPIAWLAKPVADRKLVATVSTALRRTPGGSDAS